VRPVRPVSRQRKTYLFTPVQGSLHQTSSIISDEWCLSSTPITYHESLIKCIGKYSVVLFSGCVSSVHTPVELMFATDRDCLRDASTEKYQRCANSIGGAQEVQSNQQSSTILGYFWYTSAGFAQPAACLVVLS